jgi:hypothetical protein
MTLKIKPYRDVSPLVIDMLQKGVSITNLLTDYKTPCYVYKAGNDDLDMIATNIGFTLSEEHFTSFIFENRPSNEIYTLKYISGIKKILRTPHQVIPTNFLKQVPRPYFSQITIEGSYKNILLEFEKEGWEIISTEANPVGWKRNALESMEIRNNHHKNYNHFKKLALDFYKSQ